MARSALREEATARSSTARVAAKSRIVAATHQLGALGVDEHGFAGSCRAESDAAQ
jgi:hypothetical protein